MFCKLCETPRVPPNEATSTILMKKKKKNSSRILYFAVTNLLSPIPIVVRVPVRNCDKYVDVGKNSRDLITVEATK